MIDGNAKLPRWAVLSGHDIVEISVDVRIAGPNNIR